MERLRPREEMVIVFWENSRYPNWVWWNLAYEEQVAKEESDYYYLDLLRKARKQVEMHDTAALRRSIEFMAQHFGVWLKPLPPVEED